MKKTFVLDTNVLLHDARAFRTFKDNEVHILYEVLTELDNKKNESGSVGYNSRSVSRDLAELSLSGSLKEGVVVNDAGGRVHVVDSGINCKKVDDVLIEYVKHLHDRKKEPVILITKDTYVLVKARSLGLECQDYEHDKVKNLYTGHAEITRPDSIISQIYREKSINLELLNLAAEEVDLAPNLCLTVCSNSSLNSRALCRVDSQKKVRLIETSQNIKIAGISPLNAEQRYAMDMLLNPEIHLVSIIGASGSGKTLISLACAIHLQQLGVYEEIIVTRKEVAVGEKQGFLPGNEKEKTQPWMKALYGCLNQIGKKYTPVSSNKGDKQLTEPYEMFTGSDSCKGIIQTEALAYVRGITWSNSLIILDECQNLHINELKTLVTRAGRGSKVILLGDVEQIDEQVGKFLDKETNGLTQVVQRMKGWYRHGHITLHKTERSELAKEAVLRM